MRKSILIFSFFFKGEDMRSEEDLQGLTMHKEKVNMAVAVNRDTNNVSCCNEQLRLHPWLSSFQHIK